MGDDFDDDSDEPEEELHDLSGGWRDVEDALDVPSTDDIVAGETSDDVDRPYDDQITDAVETMFEQVKAATYAKRLQEHYEDAGEYFILQVQDSVVEPIALLQDQGESYLHPDYAKEFAIGDRLQDYIADVLHDDEYDDDAYAEGTPPDIHPLSVLAQYAEQPAEKEQLFMGANGYLTPGEFDEAVGDRFDQVYDEKLTDLGPFRDTTRLEGAILAGGLEQHYGDPVPDGRFSTE